MWLFMDTFNCFIDIRSQKSSSKYIAYIKSLHTNMLVGYHCGSLFSLLLVKLEFSTQLCFHVLANRGKGLPIHPPMYVSAMKQTKKLGIQSPHPP